jgi:hypothetical protein
VNRRDAIAAALLTTLLAGACKPTQKTRSEEEHSAAPAIEKARPQQNPRVERDTVDPTKPDSTGRYPIVR